MKASPLPFRSHAILFAAAIAIISAGGYPQSAGAQASSATAAANAKGSTGGKSATDEKATVRTAASNVKVQQPAAGSPRPWLYENSDVPIDPNWTFGTLPNGVKYAVRRNQVPPRQVSIRVRIDAGSLMEGPDERGFAHLIEHLAFRGSRNVPDGESKRIWQRLGATFGSDSNAQTGFVGTSYALDLPAATPAGLDESMMILSGMMAEPNITTAALDAERAVVLAELRESDSPLARVGDASRAFYFSGQPIADRAPIGTVETLNAARAEAIAAFHARWYRPDRAVVIMSGDIQPDVAIDLITRHFGGWTARGPATPEPPFGDPDPKAPATRVIVSPAGPPTLGIAILRPWRPRADTIAYNQRKIADDIALQIINRRLESVAQAGGSFIQANIRRDEPARSADGTFISIVPSGPDWARALTDVRAIIEDARTSPPSNADIDREFSAYETAAAIGVENIDTSASAAQADLMLGALDIRETVVTPQAQLDILRGARRGMTRTAMRDAVRRLMTGVATRTLLTLPQADPTAETRLAALMQASVLPNRSARLSDKPVTIDRLPRLPAPGTVVTREPIGVRGSEKVVFSNGVTLIVGGNRIEDEKVRINVRFGGGYRAISPDRADGLWAGPLALMASGIGDLGQSALDELTNARRIALEFDIDDDAFEMQAVSRPADYRDQLRLYATKLAAPRWDAAPVERAKAAMLAAYDAGFSSADGVLNRNLGYLLRNRDGRFLVPDRAAISALTPATFRATWEPVLAAGPIEVQLFGDVTNDQAIEAVAATFGALPSRASVPETSMAGSRLSFPTPTGTPDVLRHKGLADQAAAAIAWPTAGGLGKIRESRVLDILAEIISDRLFDKLRSVDGSAYSPTAGSSWPTSFDNGGYVVVMSPLRPDRIAFFYETVGDIIRDLANTPVSADELSRTVEPMRQLLSRASTGNAFWMMQLEGYARDPRVLDATLRYGEDLSSITPQDVLNAAQTYLSADQAYSVIVLPEAEAVPSVSHGLLRGPSSQKQAAMP